MDKSDNNIERELRRFEAELSTAFRAYTSHPDSPVDAAEADRTLLGLRLAVLQRRVVALETRRHKQ
jgi:hypothetical protein